MLRFCLGHGRKKQVGFGEGEGMKVFERELIDTGIVIREESSLVCIQSAQGSITDLYWVPQQELKVGDRAHVFRSITPFGTSYIGEKYV